MVDNNIINELMKLGMSEYEAKAYFALIIKNPLSPYEIAKKSSISTAKIYEVLNKLYGKKMIFDIIDNGKKKYIPIEPDDLIKKHRASTNTLLNSLKNNLNNIKQFEKLSYIWNLNDYSYLMNKAIEIMNKTKKTLLISIWKEEFNLLKENIIKCINNKIKTAIIHFGEPDIMIKEIFRHPIESTLFQEKGGRSFVLISDSKEILMSIIFDNGKVEGAYSNNYGFIMMAEDYVKHDIYIMKIVERFNDELVKKFGENYYLLRDIFNNKEAV
ncbi:MAG: TrmB family transcriptional regulator [Spirochaetes bacterium]|nr:TrmB family transcriptional regulator [Spirochaetota bacterium]